MFKHLLLLAAVLAVATAYSYVVSSPAIVSASVPVVHHTRTYHQTHTNYVPYVYTYSSPVHHSYVYY
ncbi:Methylcrotonoyl-CoA carboxylase subunit alpha, mitochondrial [Frankliniella fusca]|uniref:Methylcrotonoyl-CoA carboxylase subunit alpha, mitochondrial n=1 Tax=Frankliniella fusca TaxID=407009 RepID=A0AAE1HR88_9NEOP|nr:Methylcrotonoyl-CoA carboxylase subunit alpha, mitochondrial [Frankliniella fusca]